jgi:hypothetical protein
VLVQPEEAQAGERRRNRMLLDGIDHDRLHSSRRLAGVADRVFSTANRRVPRRVLGVNGRVMSRVPDLMDGVRRDLFGRFLHLADGILQHLLGC